MCSGRRVDKTCRLRKGPGFCIVGSPTLMWDSMDHMAPLDFGGKEWPKTLTENTLALSLLEYIWKTQDLLFLSSTCTSHIIKFVIPVSVFQSCLWRPLFFNDLEDVFHCFPRHRVANSVQHWECCRFATAEAIATFDVLWDPQGVSPGQMATGLRTRARKPRKPTRVLDWVWHVWLLGFCQFPNVSESHGQLVFVHLCSVERSPGKQADSLADSL